MADPQGTMKKKSSQESLIFGDNRWTEWRIRHLWVNSVKKGHQKPAGLQYINQQTWLAYGKMIYGKIIHQDISVFRGATWDVFFSNYSMVM